MSLRTKSETCNAVTQDGIAIADAILSRRTCDHLINLLIDVADKKSNRRRGGLRNVLTLVPPLRVFVESPFVREIVETVLSPSVFLTRAILFDKSAHSNWDVPWHQDTTIAAEERVESLHGFGPWSNKAGVVHVRPPVEILDNMITLRVHLDACDEDNGALWAEPGSHRFGIATVRPQRREEKIYPVNRGGVLMMRPLTWHRSSKAINPSHRRVLHFEFADVQLPSGLEWHRP